MGQNRNEMWREYNDATRKGVRNRGVSDCGGEAVEARCRVEGREGRVLASGGVQAYIYKHSAAAQE